MFAPWRKERKAIIKNVALGVAAALSIATSHYVGFLAALPLDAIPVVGLQFSISFISTAAIIISIVLLTLKFIIALLRALIQVFYSTVFAFWSMLAHFLPSHRKPLLRQLKKNAKEVSGTLLLIHIAFGYVFLSFFVQVYHGFSEKNAYLITFVVVLVVGAVSTIGSETAFLSPSTYFARVNKFRRWPKLAERFSNSLAPIFSALLVLSAGSGLVRAQHLMQQPPAYYHDNCVSMPLRILLSSSDSQFGIGQKIYEPTFERIHEVSEEKARSASYFVFLDTRRVVVFADNIFLSAPEIKEIKCVA